MRCPTVAAASSPRPAYAANGARQTCCSLSRFLSDAIALTARDSSRGADSDVGQLERTSSAANEGPPSRSLLPRPTWPDHTGFVHALSDAVESAGAGTTGVLLEPCARPSRSIDVLANGRRLVVDVLPPAARYRRPPVGPRRDEEWTSAPGRSSRPNPAGAVPDSFSRTVGRQPTTPDPNGRRTQIAIRIHGRLITVPFSFRKWGQTGSLLRADPNAPRGSPASPSSTRNCATYHRAACGSWLMLSAYRPSMPASATPSAWTPRPPTVRLLARCATPATTLASFPASPIRTVTP